MKKWDRIISYLVATQRSDNVSSANHLVLVVFPYWHSAGSKHWPFPLHLFLQSLF